MKLIIFLFRRAIFISYFKIQVYLSLFSLWKEEK